MQSKFVPSLPLFIRFVVGRVMSSITSLFARHTRLTLLALLTILVVFLLLSSSPPPAVQLWHISDPDLSARLERSHNIYEKLLKSRQGLIKRFGPHPKDVVKYVNV